MRELFNEGQRINVIAVGVDTRTAIKNRTGILRPLLGLLKTNAR